MNIFVLLWFVFLAVGWIFATVKGRETEGWVAWIAISIILGMLSTMK